MTARWPPLPFPSPLSKSCWLRPTPCTPFPKARLRRNPTPRQPPPGPSRERISYLQCPTELYRHRGESCLSSPATPPDKRVRIRRFEELRSTETGDSQF